jgi:hypothetical protein
VLVVVVPVCSDRATWTPGDLERFVRLLPGTITGTRGQITAVIIAAFDSVSTGGTNYLLEMPPAILLSGPLALPEDPRPVGGQTGTDSRLSPHTVR